MYFNIYEAGTFSCFRYKRFSLHLVVHVYNLFSASSAVHMPLVMMLIPSKRALYYKVHILGRKVSKGP
jgi:hypothetical protein